MSDHPPILLKCFPRDIARCRKKSRFHFENMWLTDPSCRDNIASTWTSTSSPDVIAQLLRRLEKCSIALGKWNHNSFRHVGLEIKRLEDLLRTQRDALSRRQILGQIREQRKKEEILWGQRARSDYLKYRDANTRWFHSRASMRRAANSISGLRDNEGELHNSMDIISNIVVKFLKDLFATSHPHAMDSVLDCVTSRVTETMNESVTLRVTETMNDSLCAAYS